MDQRLTEFSSACTKAADLGGQVLLKWLGKTSAKEKGFRDLVTQADLESQQVICDFLLSEFPDHRFVGEEDSFAPAEAISDADYCWIVDPLDGTTNYVHQLRSFAVSVALQRGNETLVGSVLDPVLKECYSAIKNQGATLNGNTIQTSRCDELGNAMFVFSFGRGIDRNNVQVTRFLNTLESAGSVRRLGSAALNLCYLACGRVDGYWATELKKWDVAAGWLIATEAGATIKDFRSRPIDLETPYFCATSSEKLYDQIRPLLDI